jgi:hypothetical protein
LSTRNRTLIGILAALLGAATLVFFSYRRWDVSGVGPIDQVVSLIPPEANSLVYVDLDALRQSPFLAELYRWAPQTSTDVDYTQFVQSTSFDYEKDLHRLGIAMWKNQEKTTVFAVAEGKFDRKKIAAYAGQTGTKETHGNSEFFSVMPNGSAQRVTFTFLRNDLIALTTDANLEKLLGEKHDDADMQGWRERCRRLAGSPVFLVMRQDASPGAVLGSRTPGGLQSPQLSALLDQLQWVTVAGKPAADHLRVVIEGETTAESTTRQLSEALNGLLLLAQAGLSDPKMREQLQPEAREAYLEMLKSTDVSRIDRGETKSVRLVFDITPQFLEAARNGTAHVPAAPQKKQPLAAKGAIRN